MEMYKYDRATLFLKSLEHIDQILEFLNGVKEHGLVMMMREAGFAPNATSVVCNETDVTILILAFEKEKAELEEAFKAL